jgi:hypothetical protein
LRDRFEGVGFGRLGRRAPRQVLQRHRARLEDARRRCSTAIVT